MSRRKLNTGQKVEAPDAANIGGALDVASETFSASSAQPVNDCTGNYTTAGVGLQEVLKDLDSSWTVRKNQSLLLSQVYFLIHRLRFDRSLNDCCIPPDVIEYLSFPSYGSFSPGKRPKAILFGKKFLRVSNCSTYLEFSGLSKDSLTLHSANFCRDRLCPQCCKRRSLKIFAQTSAIMDYLEHHFPGYQFIFFTLTVRNCSSEQLSSTIDLLQDSWRRLYNNSSYFRKRHRSDPEPLFMGSFRTLEVKRGRDGVGWHPHLHVIVAVKSEYFHSDRYLDNFKLSQLWRQCLGSAYDDGGMPVVTDIRACSSVRDPASGVLSYRDAVAELSKYVVKSQDYLSGDMAAMVDSVETLSFALAGRRLCSYTGCFAKARQQLALDDPIDGDLVNVDQSLRPDVAQVVFKFRWHCGAYILFDEG